MKTLKSGGKFFYGKLVAIFLVAVIALAGGYFAILQGINEKNILQALESRALREREILRANLDLIIEELSGVARRIELARPDRIPVLEMLLNQESSTTFFGHIYLVAKNGLVYSDNFFIYGSIPKFLSHLPDFLAKTSPGQKFILEHWNPTQFLTVPSREVVIYGINLGHAHLAGEEFIALVATTGREFFGRVIFDKNLSGEDNGPNSAVRESGYLVDSHGHYIVNGPKAVTPGAQNNFFINLSENGEPSISSETIREKMRGREAFSFNDSGPGGSQIFYMLPFTDTNLDHPNWYFAISGPVSLFSGPQMAYALLGVAILGIAVLFLGAIIYYALRSNRQLCRANEQVKVRSEFLSNMSHEIRTPLNGLIGLNYLITTHLGEQERLPQIRDWLMKSRSLADYLLSLLNDILDMSKLQAGKIDIASQPFSIEAMLDDIWYMQSANMEKNGIHFTITRDISWPNVVGDETRTKQILTNILGNASKFTPKDGTVTLEASQASPDQRHVITTYRCADSGIGMSAAFLKKIFDPFTQEPGGQKSIKGTGLGMPICKELTEAMGGTIEVESVLGSGTVFVVRIPTLPGEPLGANHIRMANESLQETAWSAQTLPDDRRVKKILLAEDSDFNAEFLKELLEDEGFEVVHAENGKIALEIFEASAPDEFDIILMDMQMPVMDGCESAAAIRALDRKDAKSVLIYACTASTFKDDLDRALHSGMNDFLTKPINIKSFLAKLKLAQ